MRNLVGRVLGHALLALALVLCASGVWAQATGQLSGFVTNDEGGALPGVAVTVTNVATNQSRLAMTGQDGYFAAPLLPPGDYNVTAAIEGFVQLSREGVRVSAAETARISMALSVGEFSETMTVTGETPLIETSNATLGIVVDRVKIVQLPLNGRNFTQLLSLSPGVAPVNVSQSRGGFTVAGVGQFTYPSINGQTNRSNIFTLDGIYNTGVILNTPQIEPIIDTILEFKVQSHNDQAEFGQGTGGIVNVVTKSGTNEIHGSAWEFLRNDNLDANNFFTQTVTPFSQNQFGVAAGGPIVKNKLFFFGSFQEFRFRRSGETFLKVPSSANLGGDLSDLPEQVYNPFSTREDPNNPGNFVRDPFPNNQIPQAMIDQGSVVYANTLLPRPSLVGPGGTNALNSSATRNDQSEFNLRGDYYMSERDIFWVRWSEAQLDRESGGPLPSIAALGEVPSRNVGVSWVHTFGPTAVMQLQFGRIFGKQSGQNRYREGVVSDPQAFANQVGFAPRFCCSYRELGEGTVFVPGLNVDGWFSGNESNSIGDFTQVWQYKGSFTKIAGNHTWKFGAELNAVPNFLGAPQNASSTYRAFQTSNPAAPGGTGSALASFLLDTPDAAGFRNRATTHRWGGVAGFFVQDSWKATPKLTVNIGLRYDRTFIPPLGRADDEGGNIFAGSYDFERENAYLVQAVPGSCAQLGAAPCIPTPDGSLPANVKVEPRGKIYHDYSDNWQPRFGLAYRLSDKTALRSSFGMFFDSWSAVVQLAQNYSATWPGVGETLANNLNNPTSAQPTPTTSGKDPISGVGFPAPDPFNQVQWFMDPHYKNGYSAQWNFGIQHQIDRNTVIEANYVGSSGTRLGVGGFFNTALVPGPGPIQDRQPWPFAIPTFYDRSIGNSHYNAFQFSLDRKYSNGLAYIISYTYSKNISTGCDGWFGVEGCSTPNPYDISGDRSRASIDLPQVLTLNWVYELPFGPGQKWNPENKVLRYIIGNWQLNGIASFYDGQPFSVGVAGDIANTGNYNCCDGFYERLNATGEGTLSSPTPARWFDTGAFAAPAPFTFGNTGRNILRRDGAANFDISVFRQFRLDGIREGFRIDLRAEAFNALNSPEFARPGNNLSNPNFGAVTSTQNQARIIQVALKIIF
jgi:hypothetical protein